MPRLSRFTGRLALLLGAVLALCLGPSVTRAAGSTTLLTYTANPPVQLALAAGPSAPFPYTSSQCAAQFGFDCYTPAQIRTAYDVPSNRTGAGQTIVIVAAYGSPTVRQDLQAFDAAFSLADPMLNVFYPEGRPAFNPRQHHVQIGWAFMTDLEVEWAHAIAPAAAIDLVVAPNNGAPALTLAQRYAVDHRLGQVMALGFGAAEGTMQGRTIDLQRQEADAVYRSAQQAGVTVFVAAGDAGAASALSAVSSEFPASDPLVTAVGGTSLFAGDTGGYQNETVWNDSESALCVYDCTLGSFGASGGAPSAFFDAPAYQQALSGQTARTTADVAYDASLYTGVVIYAGFNADPSQNGFYVAGGTAAGAAQWAGIAALANEAAGHALGLLNPALYAIGANAAQYAADFHDVKAGDNGFFAAGFSAGTGYDLPTGLGTPDVANLIGTLSAGTSG